METQKLQFTFYGHANLSAEAVARCSVYGGPDYDIHLKGSASLVQYFFDKKAVEYGKQVLFHSPTLMYLRKYYDY